MDVILAFLILGIIFFVVYNKQKEKTISYKSNNTNKSSGGSNRSLRRKQKQLLKELHQDYKAMARIINHLKLKHPGEKEIWYVDKALFDLRRDRRF